MLHHISVSREPSIRPQVYRKLWNQEEKLFTLNQDVKLETSQMKELKSNDKELEAEPETRLDFFRPHCFLSTAHTHTGLPENTLFPLGNLVPLKGNSPS